MNKKMANFLIILGLLILVAGLLLGLKEMKPVDFILWAAIITAVGVLFGAFGNRIKEMSSSEKSNKVLENTQKVVSGVDTLNQQTNTIKRDLDQFIDENRLDGTIIFGKDQIDTNKNVTIKAGMSMSFPFSMINSSDPIRVGEDSYPIKWAVDDNKLEVTCICYDLDGNWMVDVNKNYWRRNPNVSSKFNYDSKGFEVIDNKGNVALSIDISQKNVIAIQGYFSFPKVNYLLVFGKGMITGNFSQARQDPLYFDEVYKKAAIRNLFLYDRQHYLGVRNM